LLNGHLVGSLASLVMVGLGLLISTYADSNRVSLSISVFTLLALFAPTQMPASAQRGWFGDLLRARTRSPPACATSGGRSSTRSFGQEGHWLIV
jgi:ABC-2 type transport system permease protein